MPSVMEEMTVNKYPSIFAELRAFLRIFRIDNCVFFAVYSSGNGGEI